MLIKLFPLRSRILSSSFNECGNFSLAVAQWEREFSEFNTKDTFDLFLTEAFLVLTPLATGVVSVKCICSNVSLFENLHHKCG